VALHLCADDAGVTEADVYSFRCNCSICDAVCAQTVAVLVIDNIGSGLLCFHRGPDKTWRTCIRMCLPHRF